MMARFERKLLIGGLLILVGLPSCRSQPTAVSYNQTEAETEIRKIEREWAQVAVTGNPAIIEQIFADEFVGVSPEGVQYTKQEFIDDTKANPLGFVSNELNEVQVRFFESAAVAQGIETFTKKDGERGRFVWTDVLVRRDGRWQIVAAQDAVAPPAGQQANADLFSGADPSAAAKREIDKVRDAYVAAWQASNAVQVSELYSEDALVLYPNQPPVVGRGAIVGYFTGFFGDFPRNEFELVSSEIVVTDDWAYDQGTYRWTGFPRAGGPPEADDGKYLVVLRRRADGSWKVARDMDNSNRPASQATRGVR